MHPIKVGRRSILQLALLVRAVYLPVPFLGVDCQSIVHRIVVKGQHAVIALSVEIQRISSKLVYFVHFYLSHLIFMLCINIFTLITTILRNYYISNKLFKKHVLIKSIVTF